MSTHLKVAITGAAGNLGTILAQRAIQEDNLYLNLLIHQKDVLQELKEAKHATVYSVDLAKKETLGKALEGVDVIVHFAGVLFKANPEKFLPETNTKYFRNLLDVAIEKKVKRIILISFPHVEGETYPESPTQSILDGNPISMHAKTRLAEECLLFDYADKYKFEGVSLRVGMVYGKGILMIDAGQWFAKHYLLGIWKSPTYIHLISKTDFANATLAAIQKDNVKGIYHIGDEGVQTLQTFLDDITQYRGFHKPWRMPLWMINTAAYTFELWSKIFNTRSPLTLDFIKIGRVSYYGDTKRMREELLPQLTFKTYKDGIELF